MFAERWTNEAMRSRLHLLGVAPLCNRRPERAPKIFGIVFPLCWRCTGLVIGALISIILLSVQLTLQNTSITLSLALMLPMIIDGGIQKYFEIESNNLRRFITGVLFSLGSFAISYNLVY